MYKRGTKFIGTVTGVQESYDGSYIYTLEVADGITISISEAEKMPVLQVLNPELLDRFEEEQEATEAEENENNDFNEVYVRFKDDWDLRLTLVKSIDKYVNYEGKEVYKIVYDEDYECEFLAENVCYIEKRR